jgi:DNA-binding transcriptional MerR regulator
MFERLSAEPIYNTRAVVRRTGVPADTFRAWERRYGVPTPLRTEGNQRLYSERDIRIIAWLREQTEAGLTISQAILLMRSTRSPGSQAGPQSSSNVERQIEEALIGRAREGSEPLSSSRRRMVEAFSRLDGQTADHILQETYAWADLEAVLVELLHGSVTDIQNRPDLCPPSSPALHFAKNFVHRKFASLLNLSNPNDGRGPIIAAGIEGELRTLTLHLAVVFLSRAGYKIYFFGADLPWPALIQAIQRIRPATVCLAATTTQTASTLSSWLDRLAVLEDDSGINYADLPVCYNGRIFIEQPNLRDTIRGHFLGPSAQDAVSVVESVTRHNPL